MTAQRNLIDDQKPKRAGNASVFELLRKRYEPPAWAFLEEVRNEDDFAGTGYTEDDLDKLIKKVGDDVLEAEPELEGLEYRVVVECESEAHQADLLARLESEGLKCRPLIS